MAMHILEFAKYLSWGVPVILSIWRATSPKGLTELFGLDLLYWIGIAIIVALLLTLVSHFVRKAKLPIIQVAIQHNDLTEKLYADVMNKGAEGIFEAQIRIIESTDVLLEANQGIYRGYWEENRKAEVKIPHGETKRLLVAEFKKGSYSGYLRIYGEGFAGGYHELNHGYSLWSKSTGIIPEVYLILTISSSPSPLRGNEVIGLRIWANNKYETEYSMSKKKQAKAIEKGLTKTQFHKMLNIASQPIKKSEKGKSQA
jgi:hypothetical protein